MSAQDVDDSGLQSMAEVVEDIRNAAKGDDKTTLGEVLRALEHASFVPVLLAPALIVVTPLSGIPFFSSFCGLVIALVAGQMFFGRSSLWIPRFLDQRTIPSKRLRDATDSLRKPARWIDKRTKARLQFLVSPPFDRITHFLCMLCGLVMPMLELVPFSSSILGAAVTMMALTLLLRDGLFALIGFGFIGVVIGLVVYLL